MLLTNRIFRDDNGVLTDLSLALNQPVTDTATIDLVAAEDELYVGSELPFNQRYFRVSTANALSSTVSVQLWDGDSWEEAVDVIDGTSTSGATLAQSGAVSWKLDRDKGWQKEDTEDMSGSGIETLKIYGLYWARIKVSADLTGTTALQFVGYKFNDDLDLGAFYPQLNTTNIKTQFQAGKTDWEDQELEAARVIIRDMKRKKEILSQNQILDAEQFRHASIYKAASIIFNEFGDDFDDEWERAEKLYREALDTIFKIDLNRNTRLDSDEWVNNASLVRR